jgi:hypothetical protein
MAGSQRGGILTDESPPGQVFRLPDELIAPAEPPKPSAPGRMHGLAILGMATSALLGTIAMFAFITISWPESIRRYIVAGFVFCIVGFIGFASIAVFTAARDTYPRKPSDG